jgi:hypothetical protein
VKDFAFSPLAGLRAPAALAVVVLLQACASVRAPVTAPAPAAAAAPASPAAANATPPSATTPPRVDPSAPRPFADVVKGATRQDGFLPLWRREERLWLEIPAAQFDQPMLLSINISNSVGERGLYGSQMGPSWVVAFRRIGGNQVQLIALNTSFFATNASLKAAVDQAFSDSLLASTTVASAAHPERKSVLIDASFLLGDISGYSSSIERAFRMSFGLDRSNSYFEKTRATDDLSMVQTRLHYATARLPIPSLMPGMPTPPPPANTPDPRSFFIGLIYNFAKLPEQAMAPRKVDPRIGHFYDSVTDLSNDLKSNPRVHYVNRWRLEKKDPNAPMSEPKQPIVYWLDRNIPAQYRASVSAGVLEWNKAFEKIGFSNAIVVRQQADDADFDTLDARHASIRWFVGTDVGFARGPNHSDPRTGEILDADIAMSDVFGRGARRFIVEDAAPGTHLPTTLAMAHAREGHRDAYCNYAEEASAEMGFALDVLEARGDIAPDSPEAEAFVQAVIKDTVMHEVGHTLGLKHNFKGSTVVTRKQLQDREFTEKHGISGSVMDYNAYNLPLNGERQGALNNTTLGEYDYWAIEYAYRPIAPAQETAELQRIAARSNTEAVLAFGDDSDAGSGTEGINPLINRFDLGDDPLAYYQKRLLLSRELWQRVQDRPAQAGDDVLRQRRVLLGGFRQLARASELVGKYVGGMYTVRDLPGTTRRAAFTPVEPVKQRAALQFLSKGLFNADSFRFKPQFLASLSPDYNEWDRAGPVSIPNAVLQVQSVALDRLMSAGTASRLLDLPLYVPDATRANIISLGEVYATLQGAIWSELKEGVEMDRLRRNLQREHLKRVQALLTRGSSSLPPDALSLVRLQATELQSELQRASRNPKLSLESRAHVRDSLALLTEALRASMTRG